MEKDRSSKTLAIIALVVAVAGLSLGFAAFASNLEISPSADVTPDDSTFKVVFTESNPVNVGDDNKITPELTGATAEDAEISGETTLTGINAHFTAPNQTVTYRLYAHNAGELKAYLNAITFSKEKPVCTAKEGAKGATQATVNTACANISIKVSVGDTTNIQGTTDLRNTHELAVDGYEEVVVEIHYGGTKEQQADGDFTVDFGNITLEYNATGTATQS